MKDLVLFHAGDRAFTVRQVLSAADFRGELGPVRQAAREGLACQRYGEDEAFETDLEDLNQAAEVYREDRDLTTAEDTERWLSQHSLTVDDFSEWLERRARRKRFLPELDAILQDYSCSDEEVEPLLWSEVVFGDHLFEFSRQLAARVATQLASGVWPACDTWEDELAAIERAYTDMCAKVLSNSNVERELSTQGVSLLRVDVEMAVFATAEAAREAWTCAKYDGEPLAEVAERAGAPSSQARLFLDDLPEALRQPAWSAVPGQVLPPVEDREGVLVCRVLDKVAPSAADDEVRERVESILLVRATDDLIQAHVKWTEAPSEVPL
jgi:hypothetical protein